MEAPSAQQLEALKYGELRRLAKSAGLKANLKVRGLRAVKRAYPLHPFVYKLGVGFCCPTPQGYSSALSP
uniref:Uncharacterized protein n=1 Tax=Podarcis muralis TaxID=64176 RepID=A0A670HKJ3_PODMU